MKPSDMSALCFQLDWHIVSIFWHCNG